MSLPPPSAQCLIDFDGDRNNNFTLIRLVLAWAVLYGHSFPIQGAEGYTDPLRSLFQNSTWIGAIAVEGFFAISGFLVTASLLKRGAIDYAISRALRIFPGLAVCVFGCVFLLGPLATNLSASEYFSHDKTYDYLSNALAVMRMQWDLPGVFTENTRDSINGSLWTLTVEVRCYLLLMIVGLFALLKYQPIASIFLLALLLFSVGFYSDIPLIGFNERWARPALYFLVGVAFYIHRQYIVLHWKLALACLGLCFFSFGEDWYKFVFPACFVYLIFYAAYAAKHIDLDRTMGDISYGVYIYAWPTQQVVASLLPDASPYTNTLFATIVTAILAWLSWNYIEKPALSLKQQLLRLRHKGKVLPTRPGVESP
ncbi:acyltransferase family protein [Gilvimarinus algae]|uniref:Acyltransferase n=1 Tax=Gilvimarinus algae TaxID=3058037 RepID=A0ABT8TED2_9GAMM|nr:acyltransferase [Gilvimarinus sp. SDUM040014]MDO3380652.1 acyltransferase [Gilvimarinus sp. SDUM040014]